ncbi:DUF4383 domain-containing protein [Mycolicibacterium goodii]|uniref:DUF4383 domain-containing protein n=1 Tax=Mycolicibacterium goodii TaxID=134601 RepID=A0ABS6HH50_MYCGD|nr:DUF4383 domain-containing protein [Mycolicibacterium goodii]OKH72209.1 membrane protein [Mycobacterium sp. SWH-M5]MBU8822016.1 DUF4383 domain-containing protein [Mycolicibacterium goodii]MBU8828511.1 DUF4383 domain-containing protein [Mycolicibacterium goodii]MBU8838796.1 DUF4383 domain-containing protein [Mycolicibacterium goodii]PJK22675.1 DUF4383 domain-containing protein [Mycolicibacterium goodii]
MGTSHVTGGTTAARLPLQWAALIVGAVFLLVGIAGFIPGITTNYGELTFASHHSGALLLGIFAVSVLHNIVHLAFGVAGLIMARTPAAARIYLIVGGVIYAVLWLYGLVIDPHSSANFVPLNTADNWLHFALAVLMIGLGVALGRNTTLRATNGAGTGAPGTIN